MHNSTVFPPRKHPILSVCLSHWPVDIWRPERHAYEPQIIGWATRQLSTTLRCLILLPWHHDAKVIGTGVASHQDEMSLSSSFASGVGSIGAFEERASVGNNMDGHIYARTVRDADQSPSYPRLLTSPILAKKTENSVVVEMLPGTTALFILASLATSAWAQEMLSNDELIQLIRPGHVVETPTATQTIPQEVSASHFSVGFTRSLDQIGARSDDLSDHHAGRQTTREEVSV